MKDELKRSDIEKKVDEYRTFLDGTLRPEREAAKQAYATVVEERKEYQDLITRLRPYQETTLSSQEQQQQHDDAVVTVDLGWNKAYCEAHIVKTATNSVAATTSSSSQSTSTTDTGEIKVFVDVGMGFHVELTVTEAIAFCNRRVQFLQLKEQSRQAKRRKLEEHVATAEDILDHLANEALGMP